MAPRDDPDRDAFGRPVERREPASPRPVPAPRHGPSPLPRPTPRPASAGTTGVAPATTPAPAPAPPPTRVPGTGRRTADEGAGRWEDTRDGGAATDADRWAATKDGTVPGSGTWSAPTRTGSSPGVVSPSTTANPDATAALLFGIASVFVLPFFLSIPAIVFARRARRTARDLPGRPGWAAATWGLWLGWATLIWPTAFFGLFVIGLTAGGGAST